MTPRAGVAAVDADRRFRRSTRPRYALRFLLATGPDALTRVLGVVYRTISRHLIKKAGLTCATGETGAVTQVQRFGSALNLNVHFHMLFLDGARRPAALRQRAARCC